MKVFFLAGDVSGDINIAALVAKLRKKYPDVKFGGLGGPQMQKAGFVSDFEFLKFNKMGYWEVIKNLPFFLSAQKKFIKKMKAEKPDVLVCVDFPGFNKKLVVEANKLNIRVIWFIAPMIWVWKKESYLKFFEKNKAHIACILPFEPKLWLPRVSTVSFVGNPTLENFDYTTFCPKIPINPKEKFTLALIPGSREQDVKNILPFMLECAEVLKALYGKIKIVVSKMPQLPQNLYENAKNLGFEIETDFNKILQEANIALSYTGTVSLQVGLAAIPHIVLYKTSAFNFFVFKMLIKKRILIGLSNIVAQKEIAPIFMQDEMKMTKENVILAAQKIIKIIEEPDEYEKITKELCNLRLLLGDKKTSEELLSLIERSVNL